jgi:hypothetical protein
VSISDVLTIGGLLAMVGFIAFAFRQGMNVKPSGNKPDKGLAGLEYYDGSGGGHGSDSGGGH